MVVTPTGRVEESLGNTPIRYGIDHARNEKIAVWYHNGLYSFDEPAWANRMETERKIDSDVDTVMVASHRHGLYRIDRFKMRCNTITIDGQEQYLVKESDQHVRKVTDDPGEVLQGVLWINNGDHHGGYHVDKSEA